MASSQGKPAGKAEGRPVGAVKLAPRLRPHQPDIGPLRRTETAGGPPPRWASHRSVPPNAGKIRRRAKEQAG